MIPLQSSSCYRFLLFHHIVFHEAMTYLCINPLWQGSGMCVIRALNTSSLLGALSRAAWNQGLPVTMFCLNSSWKHCEWDFLFTSESVFGKQWLLNFLLFCYCVRHCSSCPVLRPNSGRLFLPQWLFPFKKVRFGTCLPPLQRKNRTNRINAPRKTMASAMSRRLCYCHSPLFFLSLLNDGKRI